MTGFCLIDAETTRRTLPESHIQPAVFSALDVAGFPLRTAAPERNADQLQGRDSALDK
jgi:hypothetical protein